MAVKEHVIAGQPQDRNGKTYLVENVEVIRQTREKDEPERGNHHSDVGAISDKAAEDGAREPRTDDLDVELLALSKAVVRIEVRRENSDLVALGLESERQVDHEHLGAADSEVWM